MYFSSAKMVWLKRIIVRKMSCSYRQQVLSEIRNGIAQKARIFEPHDLILKLWLNGYFNHDCESKLLKFSLGLHPSSILRFFQ